MTTRKKASAKRTRPMTINSATGEIVPPSEVETNRAGTVTMQVSTGYEKRKLKVMRHVVESALEVYAESEDLKVIFNDILADIDDLLNETPPRQPMKAETETEPNRSQIEPVED